MVLIFEIHLYLMISFFTTKSKDCCENWDASDVYSKFTLLFDQKRRMCILVRVGLKFSDIIFTGQRAAVLTCCPPLVELYVRPCWLEISTVTTVSLPSSQTELKGEWTTRGCQRITHVETNVLLRLTKRERSRFSAFSPAHCLANATTRWKWPLHVLHVLVSWLWWEYHSQQLADGKADCQPWKLPLVQCRGPSVTSDASPGLVQNILFALLRVQHHNQYCLFYPHPLKVQ